MAVKVIIVDDNPVFLAGIKTILEATDEILLMGEAKDGPEAFKLVKEKLPDVVVMDISRHHPDFIQATKQIQSNYPDTKVLAFSIQTSKSFIKEMLDAGASGYLLKDSTPDELVRAIQKIAKGDMYLTSSIISTVVSNEETRDEHESHIILYTKLHRRPVLHDIIIRTDIIGQLEKNIANPLSLICAPAGYGKSTLASQWLEQTTALHTWISLDEDLNDLRIFLFYFRAAIEKIFPHVLEKTGDLLLASELPAGKVIAHSLLNELDQIQEAFILVLDDYHLIHDKGVHQFIDEILRYPTEYMHLVLLSRRDPPLSLSSLRSHGRMKEIRMHDLSFSQEDITDLFQKLHNILLPEETAMALKEKTEGWIGGLRLAAQAIRNIEDLDRIAAQLKGNFHSITTFLAQEVLSLHPAGIQDLMMKSSLCDRFCEHLIDEVCLSYIEKGTPVISGNEFIHYLIRNNLFLIPLDDENHWFRYHHLFQDLLNKQLVQSQHEDQIKSIHSQASKWYEDHDFIEEAIRHMLSAGYPDKAAEIIERNRLHELELDRWYFLENWLALIPIDIQMQRTELLLTKAWIYYQQSRLLELIDILERIEELIQDKETDDLLTGELSFFYGFFTYFEGQAEKCLKHLDKAHRKLQGRVGVILGEVEFMLGLARQMDGEEEAAIQILKQRLSTAAATQKIYKTRLLGGLSFIQMLSGFLSQAIDTMQHFQRLAVESGSLYALDWADYIVGWVSFQAYDREAALEGFLSAVKRSYSQEMTLSVNAHIGLALTYESLHRQDEADKVVNQLIEFTKDMNNAQCLSLVNSCRARLSLLRGDLSSALAWAKTFKAETDPFELFVWMESPGLTKARALIRDDSEQSLNEAIDFLQKLLKRVQTMHFTNHQIDILVLLTLAFKKLGQVEDALATLEEAVAMAGPRGWIRPFVEAGLPIAGLLKELLHKNVELAFIEKLLTLIELDGNHPSPITIESNGNIPYPAQAYIPKDQQKRLSQRETEILNLLSEGMRNKEIAARIHVSEDTVKKHLYNIFQKMDVHTRMELINKAKSIGLLSD